MATLHAGMYRNPLPICVPMWACVYWDGPDGSFICLLYLEEILYSWLALRSPSIWGGFARVPRQRGGCRVVDPRIGA